MGVPSIGKPQLPPSQLFLAQLIDEQQATNLLLSALCRATLGQTAEEIERTLGVTFPVKSIEDWEEERAAAAKSIADEMQAEMDAQAEAEGDSVVATLPGQLSIEEENDEAVS